MYSVHQAAAKLGVLANHIRRAAESLRADRRARGDQSPVIDAAGNITEATVVELRERLIIWKVIR